MIMSRFRQLIKNESGQAMIAALVCLALGGLIIAPLVSYTGTSVKSVSLKQKSMQGLYAADAGIEKVLWALKYGHALPTSLPQAVNSANVTITTVSKGTYTLVAGDWVPPDGPHSDDLSVTSSMVWDAGHNAYKYTVTATYSGSGNCKLTEVGVRLPVGYNYEAGSAALFGTNLSTASPTNTLDGNGAHMLDWTFSQTQINPTGTQTFYATGSGNLEGDYAWIVGTRNDVGAVGELTGTFYVITATATRSGAVAGKVEANVMVSGSTVSVTSYRVLK